MKNKILSLLFLALTFPCLSFAEHFVNLTPVPKYMTTATGELVLPNHFVVNTSGLSEDMAAEAQRFVVDFNAASGYEASSKAEEGALMNIALNESLEDEAYKINVAADGVKVEAKTAKGLYYAFQSIKKVLPPNVMAGVRDLAVTKYALPIIRINDAPRFGYRGFMLDTSRHFFSVKELKRVLEVMSYYKMNTFHWHITDDQGWRVEIKKYPKLTEVGSISDNSYMVDMHEGDFWLNRTYGPLFYTQEDVKEIVAFAKERHIEVIPEIDMPGHFSAAMASYPEYSCTPEGRHRVVSNIGGVYSDVLNVANPEAVQFAKDILTEIMEMFPSKHIHIGGDECPTTAWEHNAECIAKKNELGLRNFRELQSHFIKDMAEHLKANGREVSVWNEAITAGGADTRTIAETGATVYCWTGADGAAAKAQELGLPYIYTPQYHWYINQKQSSDANEPAGAGHGQNNLENVYNQGIPANGSHFVGVQATFWSEYVAFGDYLEYLMLPRLVAIAEAGWTPQAKRNFSDFCKRISADAKLYDYNGYEYGKHYMSEGGDTDEMVMPEISDETEKHWYRFVTLASGDRQDRCMELLQKGSPLIAVQQGKGAKENVLWTNAQATEGELNYDAQFWSLEEDTHKPGHFALVCKAQPNGSLCPVPTAQNNGGRWTYDVDKKNYNFILADNGYGKNGDHYYYSIRCDAVAGLWMNASLAGQGYAVNLYGKPTDGNGGLWCFVPMVTNDVDTTVESLVKEINTYLAHVRTYATASDRRPGYFGAEATEALQKLVKEIPLSGMTAEETDKFKAELESAYTAFWQSFGYLEKDQVCNLVNTVEAFHGVAIYDNHRVLSNTTDVWVDDAWKVTECKVNADHSQTVKLQNVQTLKFIGAPAAKAMGSAGFAVGLDKVGADVVCTFNPEYQDFVVSINGKNIFPLLADASVNPNTISSGSTTGREGSNAIRRQGAAWNLMVAEVRTFVCVDQQGKDLGTYRRSWPIHADTALLTPPAIENYQFVETKDGKSVYKRVSNNVTKVCRDQYGALIAVEKTTVAMGNSYTVDFDLPSYYAFVSADYREGEVVTPETDMLITATFSHKGFNGVKKLGGLVKEVKAGQSYVLYDTSPADAARQGFRNVNGQMMVNRNWNIEDTDPNHTWKLEAAGKYFKVKNDFQRLYVPAMANSKPVKLAANGGNFVFSLNPDEKTWKIKGTNGVCWDGLADGSLVGWNEPGHPIAIYEYYVQPYFKVEVEYVNVRGEKMGETVQNLVKAGEACAIEVKDFKGYSLKTVEGADDTCKVVDNLNIKVVYQQSYAVETLESANLVDRAVATFSADCATVASAPEVDVYWVAAVDDDNVVMKKMEPVNGNVVIPANTGVVLSTPIAMSFAMNVSDEIPNHVPAQNRLLPTGDKGVSLDAVVNAYVLSKQEDNHIFFNLLGEGNRSIMANCAYLVLPEVNETGWLSLNFDEQTGVQTVLGSFGQLPVYDLSGRRVLIPTKGGVYIQKGKKYIWK